MGSSQNVALRFFFFTRCLTPPLFDAEVCITYTLTYTHTHSCRCSTAHNLARLEVWALHMLFQLCGDCRWKCHRFPSYGFKKSFWTARDVETSWKNVLVVNFSLECPIIFPSCNLLYCDWPRQDTFIISVSCSLCDSHVVLCFLTIERHHAFF